jgi:hypothetical protein
MPPPLWLRQVEPIPGEKGAVWWQGGEEGDEDSCGQRNRLSLSVFLN